MALKLYDTIKELPLSAWIKIHEDNDLTALIIEGEADSPQLVVQW